MKRKVIRWLLGLVLLLVLGVGLAWLLLPDFGLMVGRRYRMWFVGNTHPVSYLQATPIGDSIFLSWENPADNRFDHTEVYVSSAGVPDRSATRISTPDKNTSFTWYLPEDNPEQLFFTAYTVDGNGQYSTGKTDRLLRPSQQSRQEQASPAGTFTFYYPFHKVFFQHPYYLLENEDLKCWFANGTLFALENKNSDLRPGYNPFGPLGSFLNSMDTWEVVQPGVSYPVFSLTSDMFPGSGDSTWLETTLDSNRIQFTRHRIGEGAFAQLSYTLDSTQLKVELNPQNKSKYNIRFNTFGNADFKAVTRWEAKQIRGDIQEDGKEEEQIKAAEAHAPNLDYAHQDKVFNDDYPYLNSRAFLLMGPQSEFHLYHEAEKLFILKNIQGTEDFLYKNCSGEENFTFGMRWPYEDHVTTIGNPFSFVVDVVY